MFRDSFRIRCVFVTVAPDAFLPPSRRRRSFALPSPQTVTTENTRNIPQFHTTGAIRRPGNGEISHHS